MNNLEKLSALLNESGRTVIYGPQINAETNTVISLSLGDSTNAVYAMGDKQAACYTTVKIAVYADDFLNGYNTLLQVKSEIQAAVKSTLNIVFMNFGESKYDAAVQRHVLLSHYKIIE